MQTTSITTCPPVLYTFEGALYDSRHDAEPLRPVFSRHFRKITNTQQFKATLRAGASTDLGGYPLYFVLDDGEALSFDSARKNLRWILDAIKTGSHGGWRVVGTDINYEDGELVCAHSGERIRSAYND